MPRTLRPNSPPDHGWVSGGISTALLVAVGIGDVVRGRGRASGRRLTRRGRSPVPGFQPGSLLCALPDILEVLADGPLPLWSDPKSRRQAPKEGEVDPHFSAIAQRRVSINLIEGEFLERVGNRPGEMREFDSRRRVEPDGLDRTRLVEVDLGVVGGNDHVGSPRQDLDPRVLRRATDMRPVSHTPSDPQRTAKGSPSVAAARPFRVRLPLAAPPRTASRETVRSAPRAPRRAPRRSAC